MANNVLLIDSDYKEASDFVRGLQHATSEKWEIALYENNKIYGVRRYVKFFTVAWRTFCNRKKHQGKTILCWQQFYGIALAFFCHLFHVRHSFNLVVMTFIYKPKSGFAGKLYYKFVRYAIASKYTDAIICTSKMEIQHYADIFRVDESKFHFVKWGAVDYSDMDLFDEKLQKRNYLFSTGRSNRDYDFLINALKGTEYNLIIACDTLKAGTYENVEIRNDIFEDKMFKYMGNSKAVVIALGDDSIAAGQLVLLHAMNLGIPVIITSSHGVTDDYVIDGYNGLIIQKNRKALLDALELLMKDQNLYAQISENSKKEFKKNYTKYKLGENIGGIVKCVEEKSKHAANN